MNYCNLDAKELNSLDIESGAIIFSAAGGEFASLPDFGNACAHAVDEDGDLLTEPWAEKEYEPYTVSENLFWGSCAITEYLTAHTDIQKGNCSKILCFWNEWNNSFFAFEFENEYIGVAWWTTS